MLYPVTGYFKIMQYIYRQYVMITDLVETERISRYPWPMKIMCGQGSEFIVNYFKNTFTHCEYRIKDILITPENTTTNYILEIIHQISGNLVETY